MEGQISQSNSFSSNQGQTKSPPTEDTDDTEGRNTSPQPQVAQTEEQTEIPISDTPKKKPLPLVPPFAEPRDKALSFSGKKKNSLPRVPPADLCHTTPAYNSQGEATGGTENHRGTSPLQVAHTEEHGEALISANHKKKPLPQVPPLAETRSKASSVSCQKKNSLPRVTFADHTHTKTSSHPSQNEQVAGKDLQAIPLRHPAEYDKAPTSSKHKTSSSLRVLPVKPREKLPTFSQTTTEDNTKKRRVTIGEAREKAVFLNNKKKSSPRKVPNHEPQEKAPTSDTNERKPLLPPVESPKNAYNLKELTTGIEGEAEPASSDINKSGPPEAEPSDTTSSNKKTLPSRLSLPEPKEKPPTPKVPPTEAEVGGDSKRSSLHRAPLPEPKEKPSTPKAPSTEAEVGGDSKKSSLRRVPLSEPKEKPPTSKTEAEVGGDSKKSSLRRVPLSEPKEKLPTSKTEAEVGGDSKKSSIRRVPLPEPKEKPPTYNDLKEPIARPEAGSNQKKSLLIRMPLPEPKKKNPTYNAPKEPTPGSEAGDELKKSSEVGSSQKKSLLIRMPLPEPKTKAPTYNAPNEPTTESKAGDEHKKSLSYRVPLPEPEEEAPTYSNLKELKAGADVDRKALVESVVYDDPLPVTGGPLSKPVGHTSQPPVYDDPLPVTRRNTNLNAAKIFSKISEVQVQPEPEPYEEPIKSS